MNRTFPPYRRFRVGAAICSFALFCAYPLITLAAEKATPEAAKSKEAGRLVIVRAANLGGAVVGISIDGKEVAKLNFNGRYDAPIAAGPHSLTAIPIPDREHAGPSERKVVVEPGKTLTFTAKREDVRVVLK